MREVPIRQNRWWGQWMRPGAIALLSCLFLLLLPLDGVSAQSEDLIHVVRPGENLSRIAARYGLNYMTLARYNGIANPNRLRPGQKLRIPGTHAAPAPSTPAIESTRDEPIRPSVTSTSAPARPGTPPAVPTPTPLLSCTNTIFYTVRPGDSLYGIAARYGIRLSDLRRCNRTSGSLIFVGQRLLIPYTGGRIESPPPLSQPFRQVLPATPAPVIRTPQPQQPNPPLPNPPLPTAPGGDAPHE